MIPCQFRASKGSSLWQRWALIGPRLLCQREKQLSSTVARVCGARMRCCKLRLLYTVGRNIGMHLSGSQRWIFTSEPLLLRHTMKKKKIQIQCAWSIKRCLRSTSALKSWTFVLLQTFRRKTDVQLQHSLKQNSSCNQYVVRGYFLTYRHVDTFIFMQPCLCFYINIYAFSWHLSKATCEKND